MFCALPVLACHTKSLLCDIRDLEFQLKPALKKFFGGEWSLAGFSHTPPGPSSPPLRRMAPPPPHLSDNGLVLFNSLQFLLTAHDVRSGQRQRLPVATENRLALAHISRGQGEGPSWVHRVMPDVTKDSGTSKFLPRSSKFPGTQRESVKAPHSRSRVCFADGTEDCPLGRVGGTEPGVRVSGQGGGNRTWGGSEPLHHPRPHSPSHRTWAREC